MKKIKICAVGIALALCISIVACTSSQIQQASQLAGIVVNAIPSIVSLLTTNETAIEDADAAKSDFALAQSILTTYQSNAANATTRLQTVNAALNDGQSHLNAILTAVHVTNPTTQQKVSAAVTLAIGVAKDIMADLPASKGKLALARPAKLPKPSDVQNEFNQIFAK